MILLRFKLFIQSRATARVFGAENVTSRYKVQVRVIDDTGSASFVMFDREVMGIFHKNANDMRLLSSKDVDVRKLPDDFDNLVGKKCIFKVEVSEYNLKQRWDVFTVLRLTDDPVLINSYMNIPTDNQV